MDLVREEFNAMVKEALDEHSPENFVKLNSERIEILQKTQIKKNGTFFVRNYLRASPESNPGMALGQILRFPAMCYTHEAIFQVAKEAKKIFYEENTFSIASEFLARFLEDAARDEGKVRKIFVRVSLQHPNDATPKASDDSRDERIWRAQLAEEGVPEADIDINPWAPTGAQLPKAVQDLRHLFTLDSVDTIVIEVVGEGARYGSDLRTQLKVREISRVVKRLMDKFGDTHNKRVRVQISTQDDILDLNHDMAPTHDITKWWVPFGEVELEKFLREWDPLGRWNFESVMRLEMDTWMRRTVFGTRDARDLSHLVAMNGEEIE